MAQTTGGSLMARALREHGVRYIFSLSGDILNPLYDACLDEGIRIVDCRHEQAAVYAADAWARCTGETGVAAVTGGAGVTNAITGLANAFHGGAPLLLIGGRRPLAEADRGGFGELDTLPLVTPVTKWARTVQEAARIPEYVSRAFTEAHSGRLGPVFLEAPADVLSGQIEDTGLAYPVVETLYQGDPKLIDRAAQFLEEADRPMILAGSGIWWSRAWDDLSLLAEEARAPVCGIHLGRGAIPEDHPLSVGPFKGGMQEADLVLVLGARLNWTLDFGRLINPQARVVQVDIAAGEIGRNRAVDIGIVGDLRLVLRDLAQATGRGSWPDRHSWVRRLHELHGSLMEEEASHIISTETPIHPLRLCRELATSLGRYFTLVLDGGEIQIWAAMAIGVYEPGRWLDSGAFGTIGTGLPYALAARLARPDERVVLLTGDGSFGFSAMELDTAVRQALPVIVVIANDGAWGLIKHMQEETYGRDRVVGTELGWVRYDRMAEALGAYGEFVEDPEQIGPALDRAFSSGKPAVINVKCDPNVESPFGKRFLA